MVVQIVSDIGVLSCRCGTEAGPQVLQRVGAPGPPSLGVPQEGARRGRKTKGRAGPPRTGVALEEDVRVAESAHGHVPRRPLPDPRLVDETPARRLAVGARVALEGSGVEGTSQPDHGATPARRKSERRWIRLGDGTGIGEQ